MLQQPITGTLSLSMMLTLIRLFVKRFQGNRPKKEPPATYVGEAPLCGTGPRGNDSDASDQFQGE